MKLQRPNPLTSLNPTSPVTSNAIVSSSPSVSSVQENPDTTNTLVENVNESKEAPKATLISGIPTETPKEESGVDSADEEIEKALFS